MRFDLVDLRLFDAVSRSGSISKDAEQVHLALASASARISGMETVLGVALLQRGRRGVVPTVAGRALLVHARSITDGVERMRGDLRLFSTGFKGEIRMMSNTAALIDIVPRALKVFLTAHPGVDVGIEERTSAEIAAAVADGQAEFGVVAATPGLDGLEARKLAIDRLTDVVARSHPLAGRTQIGFVDLLDQPFVGLASGALHDHLAQQAVRLGRRITYRVRLRSFDAVARLVEAGIGVGVIPLAALERYGTAELRPNCEYCDKDLPPASTEAGICTFECTFCRDCVERHLRNVCPNCGGGFAPRPIRPAIEWRPGLSIATRPPSDVRRQLKYPREDVAAFRSASPPSCRSYDKTGREYDALSKCFGGGRSSRRRSVTRRHPGHHASSGLSSVNARSA